MRNTVLMIALLAVGMTAMAKPAYRGPITRTQADGTTITVYQHGDEFFHYLTNEAGEWVQPDADGNYQVTPALDESQIQARRMAAPRRIQSRNNDVGTRNLAPRGLVILVNFKDVSFKTSKAEMDSMHTGLNYTRNYSYTYGGETYRVTSQGSARQFFYDSSNGLYNPRFDVVGPVTVSKDMSYYGGNDSNGDDQHPEVMVQEACQLADSKYNVNFADYDNDNDGFVDFVYVVYAGYGEADGGEANTIWPHSWHLTSGNINLRIDNKTIDLYACGSELSFISKQHDGIGTFCHEFSHVMGLPDLYSTNNSTHKTMGAWDIMDYGPYNNDGNTPPYYSAYERWFMGWLTPRLINAAENVTLQPLATSNEALLITSTGKHNLDGLSPNPNTFWLLENRRQSGWDAYLPGHGMLMTKIQYSSSSWENNTVNNSSRSLGVDIIEADGSAPSYNEYNPENGYFGKAKDVFPAGATKYEKISGYPITDIAEANNNITFKFMGGSGGETPTPTPTPQPGGCDAYSYQYTSKPATGNVTLGDYAWTIAVENDAYLGKDAQGRGAQFGSSAAAARKVQMTTAATADCLIDAVTINTAMGSKGDAKLTVYIGETQLGATQHMTTTSADYTFDNTSMATGNLTLVWSNSTKAIYVKSINITYAASTAINAVEQTVPETQKFLRDGRLVIRVNGVEYDVTGAIIR